MAPAIPPTLRASCATDPLRRRWLDRLPASIETFASRWRLTLGPPFPGDTGSAAWVAPARRHDGTPAVLKLAMPHLEGVHEIAGLRFWNGDPTVRLLEADESADAMLLERCEPGDSLRTLPADDQDRVIADLLRRLRRPPGETTPFRPLGVMLDAWRSETLADADRWPDRALVEDGLRLLEELDRTTTAPVVLATDLHAGNVLRASRAPWLVIDPKPFVGDPAYDATQHLFNCPDRMAQRPLETIDKVADLAGVDARRVRLWLFARAAAAPRTEWDDRTLALARRIAP